MRIPSSVLFIGDTSRDDDRLALPELTSTFNGRPKEALELPLFIPVFSGDVEDADIGNILAGESFFSSGTLCVDFETVTELDESFSPLKAEVSYGCLLYALYT